MRSCRRITLAGLAGLLAALALPAAAGALTLAPVGSYSQPTYVGSIPTDGNRLLVAQKGGRIMKTTPAGTTTYLDIGSLVATADEQGLLSFAFPPDYATSHLLYVAYARRPDGAIEVDEFNASDAAADPNSRRQVIVVPHPGETNHYGGQLQFGPDGQLYLSTGDGGGEGDPAGNAQNGQSLLGKLLRIDPSPSGGYAVPGDNPFVGNAGFRPEIWSYGLRNPWRFSFDRQGGALAIADVGQAHDEEIDYAQQPSAARGDNFGWNCREGFQPFTGCAGSFTDPVFAYSHAGGNCAIIGGYVVHDPGLPELAGRYVYADLCVGQVRSVSLGLPAASDDRAEGVSVSDPSSFGEDACGRVYVASLDGTVYRLTGPQPTPCQGLRATSTEVSCSPATVTEPKPTSCTATVTDAGGGAAQAPAGTVSFFSSDTAGSFRPRACMLATAGPGAARCSARYRPSRRAGPVEISAEYAGSSSHLPSGGDVTIRVRPSNSFTFGRPTLHPRRGTASLPVRVPRSGSLVVHGRGIARVARVIRHRGRFGMPIRPRGKRKRRLARTGKVRVRVRVTYTPADGEPRTKSKRIRLRERR